MSHVLICDDEESICWGLKRLLTEEGHEVSVAASAEAALSAAASCAPDLAVMDIRLPGMDGLSAMRRLRDLVGPLPIIIITAFGNLETAVSATKNGAFDYLTKPFDLEKAAHVVKRALERVSQRRDVGAASSVTRDADELVGQSPAMQEVFKRIALIAATEVSVLILGETGTGKELVARAIHRHSRRSDRPLLPVNLASLSPTLVESELFGHSRGAFTGAEHARKGLLELADGGTVLFDETGDIPPSVQVKLLRAIEQQEVIPVGETLPRRSSFRVIAATNRELQASLRGGEFRQDLYYRLAGFEIHLPPLRERPDDIPLLVERFTQGLGETPESTPRFSAEAMAELRRRPWPGNIRELRKAVEHGALLARGGEVGVEHLPAARNAWDSGEERAPADLVRAVREWAEARLASGAPWRDLYQELIGRIEPPLFEEVLKKTEGNRMAAAQVLGIHRATLRKRLG